MHNEIASEIDEISWINLRGVFYDESLRIFFENLESKYHVKDEADFFSRLVNMSTANKEPFYRWIRYREGYAGELVKEILRRYPILPNLQFVMDPMCGSGSSIVACRELGIDAVGLDVNGYAILATNVKCHKFNENEVQDILNSINKFSDKSLYKNSKPLYDEEAIAKYFPKGNFEQLLMIKQWINKQCKTGIVADFFRLALLSILEECSDRKKDGNGLATRPAPISNVTEHYLSKLSLMIHDVRHDKSEIKCSSFAFDTSALELADTSKKFSKITNKELGAIIFSPPYANSFDYFESYKLELIFGGFVKHDEMKESKKRLIRNYRMTPQKNLTNILQPVELLIAEIMQKIPEKEAETGKRDGRTRLVPNMLSAYFEDMRTVIAQSYNSICDKGTMHIVVDQSAYVGVPIATDLIFCFMAEQIGFEVISVINCRRANTSGQQLKKFPYLKPLLRESIVSLRKK